MEFELSLATPADEPAIRQLLAANPIPGHLSLTYEREPDYFLGCTVLNRDCQVLVARHLPTGQVVGVANRAVRAVYLNGQPTLVGYLSQLRVDPRFQGRWLVSRGYRFLRELHADGRVEGYLAALIDGNPTARGVLVEKTRRHFPTFRAAERLVTLAILVQRPQPAEPGPFTVGQASEAELPQIFRFLQTHGPARQFFPVLDLTDLAGGATLRGLSAADFVAVRRGGEILGAAALWDQSGYKQTVVRGYGGWWGWARGPYNLWARLSGRQPLPPPGERLRQAYASLICVKDQDPTVFAALLRAVHNLAAERRHAYLLVGLAARDPLLPIAARWRHLTYRSSLYTVSWDDGGEFHDRPDGRIAHVEIASF